MHPGRAFGLISIGIISVITLLEAPPPAGYQRMTIGQIVNFLFGPLLDTERDNKRRTVHDWIRKQRLRANKLDTRGSYDVDIQSLTLLKATIPPPRIVVVN